MSQIFNWYHTQWQLFNYISLYPLPCSRLTPTPNVKSVSHPYSEYSHQMVSLNHTPTLLHVSEVEITFDFLLTIPNIFLLDKNSEMIMVLGLWSEKQALKYSRRFDDLKGETYWLVFDREYLPSGPTMCLA